MKVVRLRRFIPLAAVLLGGCATSYDLTLMPRTSGTLYRGEAFRPAGSDEAQVSVTIDNKTYSGTWLLTSADRAATAVSFGFGFGRRHSGFGVATPVYVDGRDVGEAKALLRAGDGSGLRCDFRGLTYSQGTGTCADDKGQVYDVQIRTR